MGWIYYSGATCYNKGRYAPVAQLDRALVSGTKGCRFKSCRAYQEFILVPGCFDIGAKAIQPVG